MSGQRVGYKRVSTIDQNPARQLEGVEVDRTFTDKVSGKNTDRPQIQEMLAYIREGDTVVVHSLDRLARNLVDLHDIVKTITDKKAAVTFVSENLTFTGDDSPLSVLLLQVLGAFAQFQRMIIREAQREGIAIAKRNGVYKGRKKVLSTEDVATVLQRISAGDHKAQIARDLGVSRKTLYQYVKAA
ncbi:MAG TPA: recombinase family protein [Ktedonobacteraceae bacterium]|nr:recombinase family protein [Ktedonobacteraceae bacterium]